MKKLYHYIPMVVLSFFAIIFIVAAEVFSYTKNTLLDADIYKTAMDQKSVSDSMYNELIVYFKSLSNATGIPPEVYTENIDKDKLYESSYILLRDCLSYLADPDAPKPKINYDSKPIEDNIRNYIEKDADERGLKKNSEFKKLVDNTVKIAREQITSRLDTMMLYTLSKTGAAEAVHKYSHLLGIGSWICIGLAAVMFALMIFINRHHPRDLPYWLGVLILVPACVFLVPAVILEKTDYFSSFFIRNEYIHDTVTGMFGLALDGIIKTQIILAIIGVVFIISAQVIHTVYVRHLKKQHRKHHWREDVKTASETSERINSKEQDNSSEQDGSNEASLPAEPEAEE